MFKKQNILKKVIEFFQNLWINYKISCKKYLERLQKLPLYVLVLMAIGVWGLSMYYNSLFNDIWPEYWRVISHKSFNNFGSLDFTIGFFLLAIKVAATYYPMEKSLFFAASRIRMLSRFNSKGLR
ncbi:hypothetical protein [Hydromonas duriensis]|uniref:Uncharacterized protein n=1 Tax=Hydromonas duriensis TaxID=1527608 RepID=A0A4R6Y0F7_9BURK|nr:hypothetical protein [Hydromonas duriensis]TDR27870.1 hypothetical protein DFR44_13613 [Hydromonas duriensis]